MRAVEKTIESYGLSQDDILFVARNEAEPRMRKLLTKARKSNATIEKRSYKEMQRITGDKNHQGIALKRAREIEITRLTEDDIFNDKDAGLYIAFDKIQDAGNAGAIIRSATAFGIKGLILAKKNSVPLNATVMKTSAATMQNMPVLFCSGLANFLFKAREHNVLVIGSDMNAEPLTHELVTQIKQSHIPVILVLGSEEKGISRLVKERCDRLVTIQHNEKVQSLNVSAAAAIFFYQFYSA